MSKQAQQEQAGQAKHTPGPWKAWDDDGTGTLPCVLAEQVTSFGNFYVAQCNVFEDARLIAKAPDYESALQAIADMKVGPDTDHAQLSALCMAIAKTALKA